MENEKNSVTQRTTDADMQLIERARRRSMTTPYKAGPECMDECLRLDQQHRSSFWRSVMYQMMEEEFNATVALPKISARRAE